jgi:hypothetical protein
MTKWYEFTEFAEESVNALIICVKDMRPISVRHNVRLVVSFGVTISAYMRTFVDDENLVAVVRQRARYYGSAKSRADDAKR